MKKTLLLFFVLISFSLSAQTHINPDRLYAPYTLKSSREKFDSEMASKIKALCQSKSTIGNEYIWLTGLDAVLTTYNRTQEVESQIEIGLKSFRNNSYKLNYALLETANALFPNRFSIEVNQILENTKILKLAAAAANYLIQNDKSDSLKMFIAEKIEVGFSNFKNDPIYKSLIYNFKNADNEKKPPLADLLNHDFQNGKTIVYSIQRKDRTYPGITIIKNADGKFLRNPDSSLFYIQHLCRSLSNFPSYLKNGNTPQGIYSLIGSYVSPTETIGPTPNFLLRSPFEVKTSIYYHGKQTSSKWIKSDYTNLLPESWQNYFSIYGAWEAGQIGRKLIVSHGTTDDISYYKNEIFYPFSPTKGCMSAIEIWNDEGRLIRSDQVKIMNKFLAMDQLYGFFVVVEIDNQKKPVTQEEIEALLNN